MPAFSVRKTATVHRILSQERTADSACRDLYVSLLTTAAHTTEMRYFLKASVTLPKLLKLG